MRRDVEDQALLLDMLDSARSVMDMVAGMRYESYVADRRTRRAVERELEIIGEAAGKISSAFHEAHPEIPWHKIIDQRHKLAHEHGEIQDEILWRVAIVHIPELVGQLEPLIPPLDHDEEEHRNLNNESHA